jgi:hypothetical protein
MESPFTTTSRIINEPSNSFDVLRIIAGEQRITDADRQSIRDAADELEGAYRALIQTTNSLIEANQKIIALNDQLIAARKTESGKCSTSSGWCSVIGYRI